MSFTLKVLFKTVFETQLCSSYPVPGAELMFEGCKNKVKRLLQEPEIEPNQKRPRSVSSSLSLSQVQSAKKPQESQTKQDWRGRVLLGTDKNGSTITGRTIAKAPTISWNLEECRNAGDLVSMEVDNQLQVQERNEEEDAKMIEKLKATGVFGAMYQRPGSEGHGVKMLGSEPPRSFGCCGLPRLRSTRNPPVSATDDLWSGFAGTGRVIFVWFILLLMYTYPFFA